MGKIYYKLYKSLLRFLKLFIHMDKESRILLAHNPSFLGLIFYGFDKIMHNLKLYIKRHSISIEILFLLIYTAINLGLVYFIKDRIISVFIIIFLFFLGLERLIIHLKSKMDKESLEKQMERIKDDWSSYIEDSDMLINEIKKENDVLKRKIDILKFKHENSKNKG
jgi:hypothetical protein